MRFSSRGGMRGSKHKFLKNGSTILSEGWAISKRLEKLDEMARKGSGRRRLACESSGSGDALFENLKSTPCKVQMPGRKPSLAFERERRPNIVTLTLHSVFPGRRVRGERGTRDCGARFRVHPWRAPE